MESCAGMYKRPNCDSCLQSLGPQVCLLPHDSGRLASAMLSHQEEEEKEEAGEFLLTCRNTAGCCEFISRADDAQWASDEQPIHSELCTTSSPTGCDPSVYLAHHQMEGITTDYAEVSQYYTGGCCCEGLRMGKNGFLEPKEHKFPPCWAEPPHIHYGVRRNFVVGVEVVEEVVVEEELEVILEDVQADDLLDIEVLQHEHLYPMRKPECSDL
ncbi:uncharacterized protein LOC106533873 [Austrofundulus limnaeus]|uniref:Uncharacterized protein LOC106533873 n=1 Tax=Austrofundulus limnaeus TaxID=52670 RepID=A0A2I4D0L4_AUSLI|nr:PREDICTED: uncharacterized protein LOC106533873 [Austrofundulus limnaeus]